LEEDVILALETGMYYYIKKSPARLAKWNDLIERKLHESKTTEVHN